MSSWDDPQFSEALALHRKAGPIDLHVDSIIQQRLFRYNFRKAHRPGIKGQPLFWHADIPRLQDAHFGGACMGIHYWPWESERGWRELNRQIDYLDRVASEDARCLRVWNPDGWANAQAKGQLAIAPGVEGAHMLCGKLERVAALAERGVAYMTLAHFSKNSAATPSIGRGANERDGLSPFGGDVVRELNRTGIVVDVAHVNTPGVLDACSISKVPIMCTHTGVKGVHEHARNITDEEIDAIAETGGAIGIMYAPNFLASRLRMDSNRVLDHMEHVIQRVGIRHLVLGSDYDGWLPTIPSDHRDCRDQLRITEGLRQRGYSDADVALVMRENAIRVFQDVWGSREAVS